MMNRIRLNNFARITFDCFMLIVAASLLVLGILYVVAVWNSQWSNGYLLRPAADDWNDIAAFAHYLTGKPYFKDLFFIRYNGHPQPLMLLVDFFAYKLGLYSYQYVIVYHIFLQSTTVLIYAYWLLKHSRFPIVLKVLLLAVPLLFMFDYSWWAFFHVIQGYTWAYGYVCAFITIFLLIFADTTESPWKFLIAAMLFAYLSGHFFAAGFVIWPVFFCIMQMSKQWHFRHYCAAFLNAAFAILIYTLMHTPSYYTTHDRSLMILNFPMLFTKYVVLLFAANGITTYNSNIPFINYVIGSVTICLSLIFIFKLIIDKPRSLFERFVLGVLIFSFLVLLGIAYGRFNNQIEFWSFHYQPCVLALYVPLITLIATQTYVFLGRISYLLTTSIILLFLYHSHGYHFVINNGSHPFSPTNAPDYERISLMLFSVIDLPSFVQIQSQPLKEMPYINVLAKYHYGFANHPDLAYREKQIGRDILKETVSCPGDLASHVHYDFNKWDLIELQGWAWDSVTNAIPKLILLTDDNNVIINTAAAEMTHALKQTTAESTWRAYIPYEKIQSKDIHTIKVWALTHNNKACLVQSYSVAALNRNNTPHQLGAAANYANAHMLPSKLT